NASALTKLRLRRYVPCEKYPALYGTREIAHSGSGRSQRENVPCLLFADDRPSRAGVQRPPGENPAAIAGASFHETVGLSEHLVCLGRDGRRDPKSCFREGAQLHVRGVFRQVV